MTDRQHSYLSLMPRFKGVELDLISGYSVASVQIRKGRGNKNVIDVSSGVPVFQCRFELIPELCVMFGSNHSLTDPINVHLAFIPNKIVG